MTGPYSTAAHTYWQAGWRGILPLPPNAKKLPPKGYTGADGADPSYADIQAWLDGREADGNIALRLPRHVIGVDVDNYGDKHGADVLGKREADWGTLPRTWRTTSRDDGVSGIRLFAVPEGLTWPGELGAATEIIQHGHRYCVVWPSVHPEGRTYRWISPDGVTSTVVPDPDGLPQLPDRWIAELTGGELATPSRRNAYTSAQTAQWLALRPGASSEPCQRMRQVVARADTDIITSSAHATARDGALRAIRLADEGHSGLTTALTHIYNTFTREATSIARETNGKHRRTTSEAAKEWADIVSSATNLVTANPSGAITCDCAGQITGLVLRQTPATPAAQAPLTTAVAPQLAADEAETGSDTEQRTSWWPKDLAAVLAGREDEPAPAVLERTDGAKLFYAAKVNGIIGESESGKTWVALLAVAQTLNSQTAHVVYLDFEDTAAGIIARLRALGTPDTHLTRLHYIGPDETLSAAASSDLAETLDTTHPDLIILDGFNAAMTLLGLDIDNNGDATRFAQTLLKPLSLSGATVVYVDHLPKSRDNRSKGGIGAQAKRAMTTGCALTVDVLAPFGRGMEGRLALKVDKDRPGHVRATSVEARRAGLALLTSDGATGEVTVSIHPASAGDTAPRSRGRHTLLMEAVSNYLMTASEKCSKRVIRANVRGRDGDIDAALEALVVEGYIDFEQASDGKSLGYRLVRQFTLADDLATETENGPKPTVADRGPTVAGHAAGALAEDENSRVPPPTGGHASSAAPDAGHGARPKTGHGPNVNPHTGEILDGEPL